MTSRGAICRVPRPSAGQAGLQSTRSETIPPALLTMPPTLLMNARTKQTCGEAAGSVTVSGVQQGFTLAAMVRQGFGYPATSASALMEKRYPLLCQLEFFTSSVVCRPDCGHRCWVVLTWRRSASGGLLMRTEQNRVLGCD